MKQARKPTTSRRRKAKPAPTTTTAEPVRHDPAAEPAVEADIDTSDAAVVAAVDDLVRRLQAGARGAAIEEIADRTRTLLNCAWVDTNCDHIETGPGCSTVSQRKPDTMGAATLQRADTLTIARNAVGDIVRHMARTWGQAPPADAIDRLTKAADILRAELGNKSAPAATESGGDGRPANTGDRATDGDNLPVVHEVERRKHKWSKQAAGFISATKAWEKLGGTDWLSRSAGLDKLAKLCGDPPEVAYMRVGDGDEGRHVKMYWPHVLALKPKLTAKSEQAAGNPDAIQQRTDAIRREKIAQHAARKR